MSSTASPLAAPEAWNLVAPEYVRELLPVFEHFAKDALTRVAAPSGAHVLDVAAGPGTLALLAARQGLRVTAIDFAPKMLAALRERATSAGLDIDAQVGDGMALELSEQTFDAAFSLFGLMFFPDRPRGFRELYRVLRPGGRAVVSSWRPMEHSPAMNLVYQRFAEQLPGQGAPRGGVMPLSDPDTCQQEMGAAGFDDVHVHQVSVPAHYPSTAAMVDAMMRAAAPVALARRALGAQWPDIEKNVVDKVTQDLGPGAQVVQFNAYLTVGIRQPTPSSNIRHPSTPKG
jgi:SAM-dependent methyltransferase